jgi:hypothetical protein
MFGRFDWLKKIMGNCLFTILLQTEWWIASSTPFLFFIKASGNVLSAIVYRQVKFHCLCTCIHYVLIKIISRNAVWITLLGGLSACFFCILPLFHPFYVSTFTSINAAVMVSKICNYIWFLIYISVKRRRSIHLVRGWLYAKGSGCTKPPEPAHKTKIWLEKITRELGRYIFFILCVLCVCVVACVCVCFHRTIDQVTVTYSLLSFPINMLILP